MRINFIKKNNQENEINNQTNINDLAFSVATG